MAFPRSLPDKLIARNGVVSAVPAEISAARETNDFGISSRDPAEVIPGAIYCATLDQVTDTLEKIVRPGDLVLTVGAGDIYRAGERLLERQ